MSEEQPPRPAAYSAHRAQLTFPAEGQLFLGVLPAVCKTVSNIPVGMVAVIGRQARTMSRHCLAGGSLQACSGATARRWCCSLMTTGPGDGPVSGCLALAKQRYPSA